MPSFALDPPIAKGPGDVIAGDPSARGKDKLLLGSLAETGPRRQLWLDITGEQVVAILGKRGTGKSYTLGVIAEGLAAGPGETPIAVHVTKRAGLVFDIMDIFWTSQIPLSAEGSAEIKKQFSLLAKTSLKTQPLNVDVWIPAGYERPEIDPSGLRSLQIGAGDLEIDDWGALFDINMLVEPRGMLLTDLIGRVGVNGYTDRSGITVAAQPDFNFDQLLTCLDQDPTFAVNYNDNTIRSVRQRLETFRGLPLFQGSATDLTDLLKRERVSVLRLGRVPVELKNVIVSVLLSRVLRQRSDASFAQKRLDLQTNLSDAEKSLLQATIEHNVPRTWVLLDEAHVLAGADQGSVARDAFIKYAKEGRNYGLSLALATQQPSALDSRLMSQVETLIVHQLTSPKDAAVALENVRSPVPGDIRVDGTKTSFDALLRQLTPGVVTFSCGNAPNLPRVCVASVRPRISAHGGYEA
ncbi:MAG: ATP-binding protein [Variibacter sp.]